MSGDETCDICGYTGYRVVWLSIDDGARCLPHCNLLDSRRRTECLRSTRIVSTAEYQRRWRAQRGARTGQPGRPPAPCGTAAAYKRHKRKGEPVDVACREAYNAEQREMYRRRSTG